MLTEKQVFEIRILYREGLSKLAIARRLGIAPNTVNKYL
ncbi:helix-turn-helix domain-containing protein, partial [Kosmotoga sp. DU53]